MRRLFALGVSVLLGQPLLAADIKVRSGAHDGFTRLVMNIPTGAEWRLENGVRMATLVLNDLEVVFDVAEVFDRISKERLSDVGQKAPGAPLDMSFGCDCNARAFVEAERFLVIDISEGTEQDKKKLALPLVPERPADIAEQDNDDISISPRKTSLQTALAQPSIGLPVPNVGNAVEQRLLTRIQRGVEQSVLTPDVSFASENVQAQLDLAETLERGFGLPNLSVSTVIDRDLGRVQETLATIESAPRCVPDMNLGISQWGTKDAFDLQVSAAREKMYGEFDQLNTENIQDLAKLYIYFGFGVEAKAVLKLLPATEEPVAILRAMAGALDGETISNGPFSKQQNCQGDAALWSVLSEGVIEPDIDTRAVERSFVRLPKHLRLYLGPIVGNLLSVAGYAESAHQILRVVDRSGVAEQDAVALAEAHLAELENKPGLQAEKLVEIIESSTASEHAPLALVELIENRWSQGGGVTQAELELADAYASEYRRSASAMQFQTAYIVALAINDQPQQALQELEKISQNANPEIWDKTLNRVMHTMAARSDDITFLRHHVFLNGDMERQLTVETATMIAERLLQLGFAEAALRFADRPQDQQSRRTRAELIAAALLQMERPHRALLELQNIETVSANRIRAEAMYKTGALQQAAEALAELGEQETASRYFWLADAREQVASVPDTRYREISALEQDLLAEQSYPETPLAEAINLITASSETRFMIDELLQHLE